MRFEACFLLLALLASSCSKEAPRPRRGGEPPAGSDLSLQQHPGYSDQEARQRAPEVVLVKTRAGYRLIVRHGQQARPASVEVKPPGLAPLKHSLAKGSPATQTLFSLPAPLHGLLVVRLHYRDGTTWRHSLQL